MDFLPMKQAVVFATVCHEYGRREDPVAATFVARKLNITKQMVCRYFEKLHRKGWLRSPGSPAVPARRIVPRHGGVTRSHLSKPPEEAHASVSMGAKRSTAKAPDPTEPRVVDIPPLSLRAEVLPKTMDDEARTVELTFSTGAPVERMDWMSGKRYIETLSLDPSHIRIDRLNDGGPLLDSHSAWSVADQLGAIVPGSVSLGKKDARVRVRFSKREAVEPVWQDVRDGIIRSVSVGYRVHKFEETSGKENALPVRQAVDWEPFEVSMVPIPADSGAKVREDRPAEVYPCTIVNVRAEPPAPTKVKKEKAMEDRSDFVAEPSIVRDVPQTPEPPEPPEPNERDVGAETERQRCEGILLACRAARLPQSFAMKLIGDKVSLVDAQARVFAELAKRDVDVPSSRPDAPVAAVVGDDPLVHARAGITNALLHRVAPDRHKLEDIGRPYRGMYVLDIGKALLNARGVRTTKMSRSELVDAMMSRAGLHSTSDFPYLLEDVAKKNLRSAYEALPQTWLPIAKAVTLADFKPSRQLQVGDAPSLDEVLEHGEFTHGTITEGKETVQLKTYGRIFGITRQSLINDDLNAFGEVPGAFGRKARDRESDLAWAQITGNPAMGDSNNLFDATNHGNYTASGTAISVASLGVGRASMRVQTGIDGATPLNLMPRFLIVPAAKETVADQYVTTITPADSAKANPFGPGGRTPLQVVVEPRLDADSTDSWYLACAMEQAPVLYHATLDGEGGPDLRQEEGFAIDGIKFRCRLDVAFKAADWRAIYKNAGA
jgi:hypothetical protein